MTFLKPGQLSRSQFFFFLLQAQVGLVILSLPHILGKVAGHDGWISVLLSGLIVQLLALLYIVILKKYPDKTFYDVTIEVFGTFIGKSVNILIIAYYLAASLYQGYHCTSMLKLWYYYRTPFWVLLLLFFIVGTYILIGDLQSIGQFLTISTFVILIMLFLLLFNLKSLNYQYLLPVGEAGYLNILKATKDSMYAYSGFELFLFIHPFVITEQKKKIRTISLSIWVVTILYLITTMIAYMYFPNAAKNIVNSLIYYIIPVHSTAVVRIEVFFIAGYTVLMGTTALTHLYVACTGMAKLAKKHNHRFFVPFSIGAIYIFGVLLHRFAGKSASTVFNYTEYVYSYVLLLIPALIAVILLVKRIKKKGGTSDET